MAVNTTGKLICPDCGAVMVLKETEKFKTKDGQNRKFYGCSNFPNCKCTHGAHPDGKPLGFPADARTKAARTQCHSAINSIIECDLLDKKELYANLATVLGCAESEVHFGNMNLEQCEQALNYMKPLMDRVSDLVGDASDLFN